MTNHLRCPICRNQSGSEADGIVVREYRPHMDGGKVAGRLKALDDDALKCRHCGTVLLVRRNGEWVRAHEVKRL